MLLHRNIYAMQILCLLLNWIICLLLLSCKSSFFLLFLKLQSRTFFLEHFSPLSNILWRRLHVNEPFVSGTTIIWRAQNTSTLSCWPGTLLTLILKVVPPPCSPTTSSPVITRTHLLLQQICRIENWTIASLTTITPSYKTILCLVCSENCLYADTTISLHICSPSYHHPKKLLFTQVQTPHLHYHSPAPPRKLS